jgi:predicted secreted hydrolase
LRFIGTTKGWKIDEWAVPLPKANVSGILVLNGNTIKVSGIGYHDHNWNISSYTFIKDNGWYWGKIRGNTLNVVWAKIMQIPLEERLIAVLNQDDQDKGGYINIDPENIHFYASDYRWDHGRLIPTKFALYIHDDGIDVNVTMEALSIHHVDIPLPLYWRYHVRIVGLISFHLDGETVREDVDNIQIMEFMSFR